MGIRSWLLTLAMSASLPILALATWSIWQVCDIQRRDMIEDVEKHSIIGAVSVAQRLDQLLVTLDALAQSTAAREGDLAELYSHAVRLLGNNPDAASITLIDSDGRQIFNTVRPYGTDLARSNDVESASRVFALGKPVLSGPFRGAVSSEWVVAVGIPVFHGDQVAYCLRMMLRIDHLPPLLEAGGLPAAWVSTLANEDGTVVATAHAGETASDVRVSEAVASRLARGQFGVFDDKTLSGEALVTALVEVPRWGWSVGVGVPREVLDRPLRNWLQTVLGGAVVLVLLSAVSAWVLAHYLSNQVRAAAKATMALGAGEPPPLPKASINELAEMSFALKNVNEREVIRNLAMADVLVENQQVKADLASARHDPLTGVPSRSLFLELSGAAARKILREPGECLALMFIDLDGFKGVNDRYGHQRGDEVLEATATIMRNTVREGDILGRLGGDEFAICLTGPDANMESVAANVAGRIVSRVAGIGDGIGCSIGICLCPPGYSDIATAIRGADDAMYEAKRRGKNGYVIRSWLQML